MKSCWKKIIRLVVTYFFYRFEFWDQTFIARIFTLVFVQCTREAILVVTKIHWWFRCEDQTLIVLIVCIFMLVFFTSEVKFANHFVVTQNLCMKSCLLIKLSYLHNCFFTSQICTHLCWLRSKPPHLQYLFKEGGQKIYTMLWTNFVPYSTTFK